MRKPLLRSLGPELTLAHQGQFLYITSYEFVRHHIKAFFPGDSPLFGVLLLSTNSFPLCALLHLERAYYFCL